ncbi:hypothetical protein J6590_028510 [Homalodisca vitripennis]|nr:hypothetical protein J6590_028510 [Homalodisca vitripennis]
MEKESLSSNRKAGEGGAGREFTIVSLHIQPAHAIIIKNLSSFWEEPILQLITLTRFYLPRNPQGKTSTYGEVRAKKPCLTLSLGTNGFRPTSNGRAGGLLARTGTLSGYPSKQQPR